MSKLDDILFLMVEMYGTDIELLYFANYTTGELAFLYSTGND
jgi:hypothetical protein